MANTPPANIERIATADLVPYARNARTHSDAQIAQIAASIREFGFTSPVLIADDLTIIAGHGRVMAARKLGLAEVPCLRLSHLSETQRRAYVLADNQLAMNAGWDDDLLAVELADLLADEFDIGLLGFDDDVVADLLAERTEGQPDPDDVPEQLFDGVRVSREGDVWQLGDHRIKVGDCRSDDDVAELLEGRPIQLAFTSPPYASQRKYDEESEFKPIKPDEFVEWFDAVQANVQRHMTDDGSWFVNIQAHAENGQRHMYVLDLVTEHVRKWGWWFKDTLCWHKKSAPGKWPDRLRNDWEPIYHFSRGKDVKFYPVRMGHESEQVAVYTPGASDVTAGGNVGFSGGYKRGIALPGNVIEISTSKAERGNDHPAAFPVDLPFFFVQVFSDEGDIVYDPFSGSGSTMLACEKSGRHFRGTEISTRYADVSIRRWEAFTGKQATLEGDGRTFAEVAAERSA